MNTQSTVCLLIIGLSLLSFDSVRAQAPEDKARLPVSELILYSSGVGYFRRDGQVEGRSTVDLRFKVDEINDLLKSMVVEDRDGGHVTTVTYGSRDPLTKTLKSFGLDLTTNPTLGDLLNQVRGERVELLHPTPIIGTVLGIETKGERVGEDRVIESTYLNLLTADGLQSIPLAQVQRIKLLNERLNDELQQALSVLAAGHDTQKKTVSITFDGQGKRRVGVAYVAQTPVWKTSYRLVLDEKAAPLLQGWAIVENTSDEDWNNVHLSLVSGRPVSFVMDLYQPLYTSRPVVQPELYVSVAPPLYGEVLERQEARAARELVEAAPTAAGGRIGGGGFGGVAAKALTAPTENRERARLAARSAGLSALADGAAPASRGFLFESAAQAAAQGTQAGELFQYTINSPVSLARQKSAMLPIVSQKVEGKKVSIYNERVQAKYPLNGFRLKNATGVHLMQGPITVFDGNAYAGDARIEDLAAGQERLISYALDVKTEVEPKSGGGHQELTAVKIRKGSLIATSRATEEKTYLVRNRDQKSKSVLIEHPFRTDWELTEPKDSTERTREVYRFTVNVEPDKNSKLVVREQKQLSETVQLVSTAPDVIAVYLKAKVISPKVKEALERAVTLRDRLSNTETDRARQEQRVNEISQEQGRIRENMAKLSSASELAARYVRKLDQQETELENLRQTIETLKTKEAQQRRELNDYLLSLDVQ